MCSKWTKAVNYAIYCWTMKRIRRCCCCCLVRRIRVIMTAGCRFCICFAEPGICYDDSTRCAEHAKECRGVNNALFQYANFCKRSCGLCREWTPISSCYIYKQFWMQWCADATNAMTLVRRCNKCNDALADATNAMTRICKCNICNDAHACNKCNDAHMQRQQMQWRAWKCNKCNDACADATNAMMRL